MNKLKTIVLSDTFVGLCSTKVGFIIILGTDFLTDKQKKLITYLLTYLLT